MEKIKQYLKDALDNFNSSVYSWAKTPDDYAVWISWSFGAYFLLNAAIPIYAEEQKPKNFLKTQSLFELALQPVITSYFFQLDQKQPGNQASREKEITGILKNIQSFIYGWEIDDQLRLYKNLYTQYYQTLERQHSNNQDQMFMMYCQFLEYRWLECCTDRQLVSWSAMKFPCWDKEELNKAMRHKNDAMVQKVLNPYNTIALYNIINRAFMFSDILLNLSWDPIQKAKKDTWYNTVLSNLSAANEELSRITD